MSRDLAKDSITDADHLIQDDESLFNRALIYALFAITYALLEISVALHRMIEIMRSRNDY